MSELKGKNSMGFKDEELHLDDVGSISSDGGEEGQHRTSSSFGAFVNIVCAVAGTGILGLPFALKEGGWLGILLFLMGSSMSIYTSKLLIECLYYKPESRLVEFSDIGEAAFGRIGRYFVKLFHYSATLSMPCIYILLAGLNLHTLVVSYNTNEIMSQQAWIVLSGAIVLVPFALLKSLKEVTILSVFGALCTVVVVFAVAIQGAVEYTEPTYVKQETLPVDWQGLPLAFATIAFSYTGNVVFPHIEATMRHPKQWNKVVAIAMIFITMMYMVVGVTGYLYYGSGVKSPVIDSMAKGAASLISYALITLHVILAAPIYLCSFALEQERYLNIDRKSMSFTKELTVRVAFRTTILVSLTLIAMFLPYFSDLMGLFGAVSGAMVVFLIPVVCHYKIFGWRNRSLLSHAIATAVIVVGVLGLVLGTSSAVKKLITSIRNGSSNEIHH